MNDLMTAGSDRAFLHRRRQLDLFEVNFPDADEDFSKASWDEVTQESANQLLAKNLDLKCVNPGGNEAYLPTIDLYDHEDDEAFDARLPCGHTTSVSAKGIKGLSEKDCLNARCNVQTCRRRIIKPEDDRLLAIADERMERAIHSFEQIDWERLDEAIVDDTIVIQITGEELHRSLELALASMRTPESACPKLLDSTTFAETEALMKRLSKVLYSHGSMIELTPLAIYNELQRLSMASLREASVFGNTDVLSILLPPGFGVFLHKWLSRTVNHVAGSTSTRPEYDAQVDLSNVMTRLKKVDLELKARSHGESIR
ncbi:hypothetical protein LTR37_014243 [Vermiconidia calcicola]|uniref:Uncharacterized protein n=1 Tax=Vermiconidia calcicola TaxID=1690605 RepID=A0ACC3MU29_9PEZI|nr:hypothetical protein LTR37_014243 [Vermiconidia calcicola]